ncbi:hypothetical protein Val02_57070 [Virgisporangium aliadipatigenens]|uniref:Uncharacterized protein n=1 Tax=Virgisporangium aliadipatigenens TaxID=741659 RepID=A0A8J4DT44_9ACTN|nr:hypothetical protein Val02_57070 [Virgisporangium aliadipatigenens]
MWPCRPARAALLNGYPDREQLAADLTRLTGVAAADLGVQPPPTLYRLFVGWALDPDRACRICGKPGHDATPGLPPRLIPCDKMRDVMAH